jgi:hypothetical protein
VDDHCPLKQFLRTVQGRRISGNVRIPLGPAAATCLGDSAGELLKPPGSLLGASSEGDGPSVEFRPETSSCDLQGLSGAR